MDAVFKLDYSNRDEDGSVGTIPDSLKTEFKTLVNKRSVYDGGGIEPDVEIEPYKYSNILRSIIRKGIYLTLLISLRQKMIVFFLLKSFCF